MHFKIPIRRTEIHTACAIAGFGILFSTAQPASADAADPLKFIWSETLSYDDNLFRLPTGTTPAALTGNGSRSDLLRMDSIGFKFDKQYSLQNLSIAASADHYHYRNYSYLSYTAGNASLAWDWAFTPDLTGRLSADRRQVLNSFSDYRNITNRNIRTNNTRLASLNYRITGGWHLVAAANEFSSISADNSSPQEDVYRSKGVESGVKYDFASGSSLQYVARRANGQYPDMLVNQVLLSNIGFRQTDQEVQGLWLATGKLRLSGRMTHFQRRNDNFPQRDFGGTSGRLDVTWTPTAKLSLLGGVYRDYASYFTPYSNYIVSDGIFVSPVWQITSKTSLRARLTRTLRDYRGQILPASSSRRHDALGIGQVEFDWNVNKALTLSAIAQHENRNSNYAGFAYSDNTVTFNARFTF